LVENRLPYDPRPVRDAIWVEVIGKGMTMKRIRSSGSAILFCSALFFLSLPFSAGQEVPTAQAEENASEPDSIDPLTISVSVNEVRLDVVVLDKKGNPITDLTADDFEVFQDNKRQTITSGVYIDSQPDSAAQPSAARKSIPNIPQSPTKPLKKEDVRRTILFVVDDYAMSFENGYYTKMALRNFVEKQMTTGDLVAILRTDYGNRALNMFFSDKREALARINALPSTMAPRPEDGSGTGVSPAMWEHFLVRRYENQMSTLSYSISALKDMPGRKILIMVTPFSASDNPSSFPDYLQVPTESYLLHSRLLTFDRMADDALRRRPGEREMENIYKRLADNALRAGVVVNFLDIDGLYISAGASANQSDSFNLPSRTQEMIVANLQAVQSNHVSTPNPLPALTGGVFIRDGNFFLSGIGKEAESLMKGYYLITYAPPPDTFETRDKKDDYRRLKVRVKRKGAVVHTRDGFFGRLESESDDETTQNPLIEAIYSPFKQDDINVNIAAGYVKDAEAGYLIRSWIHLDPDYVKIVETEDGGARIDLDTVFLASDINGGVQDARYGKYTFAVEPESKTENIAWIQKHGIRFSMLLPVKKPGSYYVRIAVQEKESGKLGSAYQFLEIPDLGKKDMALSNIFMLTSADDLNWMFSDATKEIDKGVFFPMFQGEGVRSPALRTYLPGDNLQTLAMLYNVDAKALARSEIETQTILYKDGVEFMRGEPTPITPDKVDNLGSIPLLNRLTVGTNMPPGDMYCKFLQPKKRTAKKRKALFLKPWALQLLKSKIAQSCRLNYKYGSRLTAAVASGENMVAVNHLWGNFTKLQPILRP